LRVREIADQLSSEVPVRKFEQSRRWYLGPVDDSQLDETWKNARRLTWTDTELSATMEVTWKSEFVS
jgi:hypothetical protein